MRSLTLNEKITIKGFLNQYGLKGNRLITLAMGEISFYFRYIKEGAINEASQTN